MVVTILAPVIDEEVAHWLVQIFHQRRGIDVGIPEVIQVDVVPSGLRATQPAKGRIQPSADLQYEDDVLVLTKTMLQRELFRDVLGARDQGAPCSDHIVLDKQVAIMWLLLR